jgi:hypothetical protein
MNAIETDEFKASLRRALLQYPDRALQFAVGCSQRVEHLMFALTTKIDDKTPEYAARAVLCAAKAAYHVAKWRRLSWEGNGYDASESFDEAMEAITDVLAYASLASDDPDKEDEYQVVEFEKLIKSS